MHMSHWRRTVADDARRAEDRPHGRYDVAVVGGGVTGLSVGCRLARRGARVVVLERGQIGAGTTGGSTAKVTALHGTVYSELSSTHGPEVAGRYAEANQAGVAHLISTVEELEIACDLTRAPALTYTLDPASTSRIEAEAHAAAAAGLAVVVEDTSELPLPVRRAVRLDGQAHLHPLRYCLGLASAIRAAGGDVVEQAPVLDVSESDDGVAIELEGHDVPVTADVAVIATLLPVVDHGGFFARTTPSRSYALALEVPDDVAVEGMHLSADDPIRSIRPLLLDHGRGLVVGGGAHRTGEVRGTTAFYDVLERWAGETFPGSKVLARWSAQDFRSSDGIPFVGRMPKTGRTYVATAFRKWGFSNSAAAAILLTDLIEGVASPWSDLYDPKRAGGIPSALKANVTVAKHAVADRAARLVAPSIDSLGPGEGGVVRSGSGTVAAFRDDDGQVVQVSPTCTHLGCTVQFNDAERTWDCPCHASRFDLDGSVLEGPAVKPLRPTGQGS